MFGVPEYSRSEVTALPQISRLFEECVRSQFDQSLHSELFRKPVSIVGFSKGCMVLNQILNELNCFLSTKKSLPSLGRFYSQITDYCWIDSGNCGHSGAWVTDDDCFTNIPKNVCFHVHVTPYQINDKFRPWIGEEHDCFVQQLKNRGLKLKEFFHFEQEEPSLANHFKLLLTFNQKYQNISEDQHDVSR